MSTKSTTPDANVLDVGLDGKRSSYANSTTEEQQWHPVVKYDYGSEEDKKLLRKVDWKYVVPHRPRVYLGIDDNGSCQRATGVDTTILVELFGPVSPIRWHRGCQSSHLIFLWCRSNIGNAKYVLHV